MKHIWLGTKDYCKDCWHDLWFRVWNGLDNFAGNRLHHTYCWRSNEGLPCKEGSMWYYIRQRKTSAKKPKEWKYDDYIKTKGDFIYAVWASLDEVAYNNATHQWFAEQCAKLCEIAEKKGWLK